MLPLVVLAVIIDGRWLEAVLPIIIFTLSSSHSVLPKLLTLFEARMSYQRGNLYITITFIELTTLARRLDRLI